MNDCNQLEERLRSWIPRPPAAKLKRALFAPPSAVRGPLPDLVLWQRLAPVMALFVSALLLMNHLPQGLTQDGTSTPSSLMAAASLSHPDLAAYYAAPTHSGQNTWRRTFEWTNASHSLTTAAPMFKNIRPLPN